MDDPLPEPYSILNISGLFSYSNSRGTTTLWKGLTCVNPFKCELGRVFDVCSRDAGAIR